MIEWRRDERRWILEKHSQYAICRGIGRGSRLDVINYLIAEQDFTPLKGTRSLTPLLFPSLLPTSFK